jgi:uncharacterized protein YhaN
VQKVVEDDLEGKLEKVQSALESKRVAEAELANFTAISQLDEDQVTEIEHANEGLKTRVTEAKIRENDLHKIERAEEVSPKPDRRRSWGAALAGMGGLVGIVGLIFLLSIGDETIGLPLLIAGLGVAIAGIAWYIILGRKGVGRDGAALREQESMQERYQEGIQGVEEAEGTLTALLEPLGLTTWDGFKKGLDQVRHLDGEIKSAEVALSALLTETESLDDLERKREVASRARRDSLESLKDLADAPELTAIEFQELVNKLDDLNSEREKLRDQITRAEAILQESGRNLEDLHQLEERRASWQRTLDQNREQSQIYRLVLEGLEQARQETLGTAKDELEPRLGAYLKQMTQGRYDSASVDDNLEIQVVHEAREEPVAVGDLSRGTQDQVYLAARLALSDLVFRDAKPPLLMDDPFVTFDPQRKQAALELCKRLAADRQIILFTCHEGYEASADHVIELG